MFVRCSAKQIADFVVLWSIPGTVPPYFDCAEDARDLKSLDLIISTVYVFVDAFCFNFEDIYRKLEVNFPLSEEKFIEFLKHRCLLLTKDSKCFNFMLVCAFVFEIIHSFSYYNKCLHLAKDASRCLAAILKYRFKNIFETDSGWEELMSFCLKIHDLVYPPKKRSEFDSNQSIGVVADETDASILKVDSNIEQLADSSVKKHDDLDMKISGERTTTSLKNDLTTETEGEEFCNLELSTTGSLHTLQLTGEGSLKSENKETLAEEHNASEYNERDCVRGSSLPVIPKQFTNMVGEKFAMNNNKGVTENLDQITRLKKNLTLSLENIKAGENKRKRLEDLCNLELPSTGEPHSLHLKVGDFSPKEENKMICDEKKYNEKYSVKRDVTDLEQNIAIINKKEGIENLGQMNYLKKHLTLSFGKELETGKVLEKSQLCKLEPKSPTGQSHSFHIKVKDLSPKEENKEKMRDENNLAQNIASSGIINKEGTEKLGQMVGFKKHLTLSFGKELDTRKEPKKSQLCKLELESPTEQSHTFEIKVEDLSSKEENKEKIRYDDYGKVYKGKDCVTDMSDSPMNSLTQNIANIDIINKGGTEKLGQMVGFKKHLTLSFGKELNTGKVPEKSQLCKVEPDSSIGASHAFQRKNEDFSQNTEVGDKEKVVVESSAGGGNENVIGSLVPDLTHEPAKVLIEEKAIKRNVKGDLKPEQLIGCRNKLTLNFSKDASKKNETKKLEGLHTLQDEVSSKNESEDNEPFDIRFRSSFEVQARITDNPRQLSEIMNILKKCEEDIDPNIFSPDELNIPIYDFDEGESEASGGISESSNDGDKKRLETSVKTAVYIQNMRMADSIKNIFLENILKDEDSLPEVSGGEPRQEMSDEVAYEYGIRMLEPQDPRCPLCADGGKRIAFFDTYINNFATRYSNNAAATTLIRCNICENISEGI